MPRRLSRRFAVFTAAAALAGALLGAAALLGPALRAGARRADARCGAGCVHTLAASPHPIRFASPERFSSRERLDVLATADGHLMARRATSPCTMALEGDGAVVLVSACGGPRTRVRFTVAAGRPVRVEVLYARGRGGARLDDMNSAQRRAKAALAA